MGRRVTKIGRKVTDMGRKVTKIGKGNQNGLYMCPILVTFAFGREIGGVFVSKCGVLCSTVPYSLPLE